MTQPCHLLDEFSLEQLELIRPRDEMHPVQVGHRYHLFKSHSQVLGVVHAGDEGSPSVAVLRLVDVVVSDSGGTPVARQTRGRPTRAGSQSVPSCLVAQSSPPIRGLDNLYCVAVSVPREPGDSVSHVVVRHECRAHPDWFSDALQDDVADARKAGRDPVTLGTAETCRPAEDHVDLRVLQEPQCDPRREEIAEARDVLAGVLHRCHDQHVRGVALRQQQLQRGLGPPLQVAVTHVCRQRSRLIDQDHHERVTGRRHVDALALRRNRSTRMWMNDTASSRSCTIEAGERGRVRYGA